MDNRVLVALGALALLGLLAWATRPPAAPPPSPGAVLGAGAVVAYSPGYRVSFFGLERLHPFDIRRADKIAAFLREEGLVPPGGFAVPAEATEEALAAVHDPAYLASLKDPAVLSQALEVWIPGLLPAGTLDRRALAPFRRAAGGTLLAARGALERGVGINLGGGFHHARPAMGHGFCVYNDVAYALHALRQEGLAGPVLIVDTDAHQGDGNHAFFAADPSVYAFSMQQERIFPSPRVPGDRDVDLPAGTGDERYLAVLEENLAQILAEQRPALAFHVAGADVLADDPLAGLALTPDGLARRDALVARLVRGAGIPLVHLLAGGYGPSAAAAQARSVAGLIRGDYKP